MSFEWEGGREGKDELERGREREDSRRKPSAQLSKLLRGSCERHRGVSVYDRRRIKVKLRRREEKKRGR